MEFYSRIIKDGNERLALREYKVLIWKDYFEDTQEQVEVNKCDPYSVQPRNLILRRRTEVEVKVGNLRTEMSLECL